MNTLIRNGFLIGAFATFVLLGCRNDRNSDRPNGQQQKVLLISIDGFINDYIERNETPNFDKFIEGGIQAEYMIPVFPTKTFPNHWSLVTGLYVENHGIISNSFYDDSLNARFSYGPPESTPNDQRWWGGEPVWVTAEKQGLTSATFFWPGSEASINGVQPTKWIDYDGSIPDSTRIDSLVTWMDPAGDVRADFGTLYFSFIDSRGHSYGPNSPEIDEAVLFMDGLLGYLVEKIEQAELAESLNIILVSDHGMAELSDSRVIFLDDIIDLNSVEIVDWNPVAMLNPAEGKKEKVYEALKNNEQNYTVYLREEMPDRYHFKDHYRIPGIIMIADAGYTITERSYFDDRGLIAAQHGYDNYAPEMRAFFAARGPAFKKGVRVEPFELIQVYGLVTEILGIEPAPYDGNTEEIKHFIVQ